MSTIVTRAGKGSPLTNAEVDSNFTNLNTDKVESITSADGSVVVSSSGTTRDLSVGTAANTGTLISQVRNETGATLTKGTVVYISGAAGNKALVSKALATGDTTSAQTYGMVQADIPHNQNGYVVVIGSVSGLNTSAFTDGTQLYLSGVSAGGYTNTKPYAPTHLVYVGIVTYSHATQGTIQVKIQNGYELDEIHDVSARSPVNGQTLVYVSSTGLWTKTDQSSMSVGSAATLATARNINGVSFNGSADITVADATKLPLTGGTLTGKLTLDGRNEIYGVPTNAGTVAGFMAGTSGGTSAARTQSLDTQTLFKIQALGYTGSTWTGGAGLSFVATENITATNRGTKAVLTAIAAGGATGTTLEWDGSALTLNGSTAVTSSNYNNYAPTKTGTGASGTWGISISGNAATTSQRAFSGDISATGQGRFTGWYTGNAATGTAAEIGMSSGEGYIFVYNRDTQAYGTLNIAASGANMQFSGSTINVGSGSLQQGGNQVLHAGNYSSYALPLTGGTLSGAVTVGNLKVGHGGYPPDANYFGLRHAGMGASSNEYMIISANANTYISAATGASVTIRGGNNVSTYELNVSGSARPTVGGSTILDAGNYSSYALPLSGGTLTGNFTTPYIYATGGGEFSQQLYLNLNGQSYADAMVLRGGSGTSGGVYMTFMSPSATTGYIGHDAAIAGSTRDMTIYATSGLGFRVHTGGNATARLVINASGDANFTGALTQGSNQVLHAGNYTNYRHDRIVSSAGSFVALTSTNELEYFNSSGVLDTLYLQYSGGGDSLRGPGGNVILHAGNYNSYAPTLTGGGASGTWGINITGSAGSVSGFKSFGSIYINPNGANANCTTAQFMTHLSNLGFFNYAYSVGKCAWDYAGNNDLTDTGFGTVDMAGCVIETWINGSEKHVRVTRPTTGAGGFQVLVYIDHGSSYSPGWRAMMTSENIGSFALPIGGGDMSGRIRMGTFTSSQNNTGEAWIGRASDRATGTMTVQLGNSADRVFEVVDNPWTTVIFNAGMNSFLYKGSAILHAGNYSSYALPISGGSLTGALSAVSGLRSYYSDHIAGDGYGIRFWESNSYKISMGVSSLYQYGTVTDYSIKMQMDNGSPGRGFTWGRESYAPIASLNATSGNFQTAGQMYVQGAQIAGGALTVRAGGASGVGWGTGLNIGDSSNYTSFIQDAGTSRWRNYGTAGYDWYSSGGSQLMVLSDAGYLGVGQASDASYRIITSGHIYANANGNVYAEGRHYSRHGTGTFYESLTTGNYTSYSPSLSGNYKNIGVGGLYSRYNYNESAWITDATAASTLSPDYGTTTVAMHNGHGSFSNWATTLTMSGYERYGAYQISGNYNASTAELAVRNYTQNTSTWTSWIRLLSSANYSSYALPLSGGTVSGSVTVSESYTNGWFRNNNSNQGLYNQSTGGHFCSLAAHAWQITGNGGAVELQFRATHNSTVRGYVYGDTGNNFGLLHSGGGWSVQVYSGGNGYLHGTWNGANIRANRANGNFYIDDNYGYGIVGVYASTRYQGVFAMGDSYKLPADGTTTGSLYGMAWSHPNAGGAAGNLTDHGLLIINNGVFKCAISNSIVASGNVTAYSDERLKTNWRDMPENYVARLAQVKVGIYDRTDQEDVTQVGVSAQSFQKLLPQSIMTAKDEMQTLSVNYGGAALASAVELAKDNVELRARIERLESLINKLIGD